MKAFSLVFRVAFGAMALPASAATFTVSNTNDSGAGSLRQAIDDANDSPGLDEIDFAIPGTGVHTILLHTGELPPVRDPVVIDGYTQAGASPNDGTLGTNAVIRVELSPSVSFKGTMLAFLSGSSGSTVRGLAIYGFYGTHVWISQNVADCVIAGNFIGTDATGTVAYTGIPGAQIGIQADGPDARIGGPDPADRNLIAGLSGTGVAITGNRSSAENNLIGTDRSGNVALGNGNGIVVGLNGLFGFGALPAGVRIGGPDAGNVIGGNTGSGIIVESGTGHAIVANLIGLGSGSLGTVPNGGDGILVEGGNLSTIGTYEAGYGNRIFVNGGAGVRIAGTDASAPQAWSVIHNEIVGNAVPGIDLGDAGPTPNDVGDIDAGANALQNHPILGPVTLAPGGDEVFVHGTIQSTAYGAFMIDLYGTACGGNGVAYLGQVPALTNDGGNGTFDMLIPAALASDFITATATRYDDGATSELAPCIAGGDHLLANGFDPPPPP